MSDSNTYYHYSAADIRRYHNGQMTVAEMYALEKKALEDPFLADAIEGYAGITGEAVQTDLSAIRHHIAEGGEAHKAKVIPMNAGQPAKKMKWWKPGIAAALTGLLIFAGIRLNNRSEKEDTPVAANVKSNTPPTSATVPEVPGAAPDTARIAGQVTTPPVPTKITGNGNNAAVFVKPDSINKFYYSRQRDEAIKQQFEDVAPAAKKLRLNTNTADGNAGFKGNFAPSADSTLLAVRELNDKLSGKAPAVELKKVATKPEAAAAQGVVTNNDNELFRSMQEQISVTNSAPVDQTRFFNSMERGNAASPANQNRGNYNVAPQPAQRNVNDMARARNPGNTQPAYDFSFNYRVTDAAGNNIPYSNITVPAENLVTYSWVDGRFRLPSEDSVLNVTVKAAGYIPRELTLRSNTNWSNIVLTEANMAQKDVVVVGDQKNHALKKKSGMIAGTLNEAEPADGWQTYDAYLANNIDTRNKPRGEVELSFSLNKQGEPVNITVAKSLGTEADEEAVRLLTKGPKWKARRKKTKGKVVITFSPAP